MAVGGMAGGVTIALAVAARSFSLDVAGYDVYPWIVTVAAVFGGLAPDVDMAHSKGGRFLRKLLRTSLLLSAVFLLGLFFVPFLQDYSGRVDFAVPAAFAAICIFIFVVIERSKHRGFTHTVVGLGVVASPGLFMAITSTQFVGADIVFAVQLGFSIGWLSHMVIDTFNKGGIPWLWPLTKKRFRVMYIGTGTGGEGKFMVACTIVFIMVYGLIVL